MFDERSLNLVSSYVKTEETLVNNLEEIWLEGIVPLVNAIAERLQYEWEQRAKIELGQETYVMTPDEFGGWKWEKADSLNEEYDDVWNDVWADTPVPPRTPANAQKMLVGSPDLDTTEEEQTLTTVVSSPPVHIDVDHWQETVEGSAIHPDIASRNFRSLHEDSIEQANEAWEYLMYSDKLERSNTGRLSLGMLRKYAHLEQGGWWCDAGVDPRSFADLQPGDKPERKLWGCFKPNEPRESSEKPGKKIKYENPPKTDLSIFLLDVPDDVAGRIYNKAGVDPSESDRQSGFWYCVWKHNVPVTITEGAKKAASILSQGEAAIGLSGIYGGYRSRDEQGNQIPPKLHPELAVFATPVREMTFCFDYETRPKTVRNIEISTLRTAGLLEAAGAKVNVIRLPGPEKGVDDFIVNNGAEEFKVLLDQAEPLEEWHKQNQKIWDVKTKPIKKKLNQDQLQNIANKLVNNSPGDPEPEDFRFTIFLKDGTARKLYEQKSGTVQTNVVRENLTESEILNLNSKSRKKPVQAERNTTSPEINSLTFFDPATPEIIHESSESIQYWSKPTDVPIFKQTIPRRFVEATENNYIAIAAKQLLNNYGVEHDDNSFVYRSDAFTIREFRGTYSIHRHEDEQASYFANPLMQFQVNPQGKVKILKNPDQMLSVERQEFLMVADYLNHGHELPTLDLDTRELSNSLGSLAPQGTQKILESFRQGEILKVMHGTLSKAKSDQVKIGEYRIQSDRDTKAGKVFLRLFKQDKIGEKEKVRFELNRTPQGITNQIRIMTLDEHDLANLKQISKKFNIEAPSRKTNSPANDHTTSPRAPGQTDSAYVCSPPANTRDISLPLHSELAKVWEQLENSVGWTSASNQGNNDLREKLQQDGRLTIGEQRELYFKFLLQSKDEQLLRGKTEIILPPLQSILTDLKKSRREFIDSTYTPVKKLSIEVNQTQYPNVPPDIEI